jgi:hypothetical protein
MAFLLLSKIIAIRSLNLKSMCSELLLDYYYYYYYYYYY